MTTSAAATIGTLDLGPTPWRRPALIALGILLLHPLAYWVTGNHGLFLVVVIDPILLLVLLRAILAAWGQSSLRNKRLLHYSKLGLDGDITIKGNGGDFFVVSTSQRRLFAGNALHDFQDIVEISWADRGTHGSIDLELAKGERPIIRLIMGSGYEAAAAGRRLQNALEAS